jgi:hypothetical protein
MSPMSIQALKEWACVCRALEEGRQIVLLRKGGISEPDGAFRVAHERFYLLPTYAHQRAELLKPDARAWLAETIARRQDPDVAPLTLWAELQEAIAVDDHRRLEAIDAEHVLAPSYAIERLRWKPREPLWALVLRIHRVATPPSLTIGDEHRGCVSWVELPDDLAPRDRTAVLDDAAFAAAHERLRRAVAP